MQSDGFDIDPGGYIFHFASSGAQGGGKNVGYWFVGEKI